jgi:diaminopimelate decarboxylase
MSIEGLPQHAPHPFFAVTDDQLTIGDRSVVEIARQVGMTPFYVYARKHLRERVETLRQVLPPEVHLHYAIKANPAPDVVRFLTPLVDGLDVASAREMQVALEAGMAAHLISFAGPGKKPEELARAVAAGVTLNVESELELERLAQIARDGGGRGRVAIRVNPGFELKSSGMKMGGGPKQFGIDSELVPQVLQRLRDMPLDFVGFHLFSGSQSLRAESIVEAQQKAVAHAIELARSAPSPVQTLNIGGGFGIPYFPGEQPLDLAPIGRNLRELVALTKQELPQAHLMLELGRYLVGEAGVYVCRVIDRKVSRGQVFLVTDGGLHHHLAASGNFGQVLRKNYPVVIGNRVRGTQREVASVVGPLCTPLDLLADRVELARAEVGDLVAVLQSGAYGLTASPLGFLSHPPPGEVLV